MVVLDGVGGAEQTKTLSEQLRSHHIPTTHIHTLSGQLLDLHDHILQVALALLHHRCDERRVVGVVPLVVGVLLDLLDGVQEARNDG